MRATQLLLSGILSLILVPVSVAQQGPVSRTVRTMMLEEAGNLRAAAAAMPADKYAFRPTPGQRSFGEIVVHIHDDNRTTCGTISGQAPPTEDRVPATASKETLVAALTRSLEFCDTALAGATDGALGDSVTWYGDRTVRARALVGIVQDWASHYSQLAMYLRLNGILPPTARRAGT